MEGGGGGIESAVVIIHFRKMFFFLLYVFITPRLGNKLAHGWRSVPKEVAWQFNAPFWQIEFVAFVTFLFIK